mgnify:FL=1
MTVKFTIAKEALRSAIATMDINEYCFITVQNNALYFTTLNENNTVGAHVCIDEGIRWYQTQSNFFAGINISHLDFWLRTIEAKTLYVSISNDFFECESEDAKHQFKMHVAEDYKYVAPKFHNAIARRHTYNIEVSLKLLNRYLSAMEVFVDKSEIIPDNGGISLSTGERCGVSYYAKQHDVVFRIDGKGNMSDKFSGTYYKTESLTQAVHVLPRWLSDSVTVCFGKDVPITFSVVGCGGTFSVSVTPMIFDA